MIEKISLEEFRQIKSKMISLLNEEADSIDGDEIEKEYIELQKALLNHDLSDIPFEEWEGIQLLPDIVDKIDLSKTRANIDLNYFSFYGTANLYGCKIRSQGNIKEWRDSNYYDGLMLYLLSDDSFDKSFIEKYNNNLLTIADFSNLSDEVIDRLLNDDIYRVEINYHVSGNSIPIKRAIELYKHSKEEYEAVNKIVFNYSSNGRINPNYSIDSFEIFFNKIRNLDVSEVKDYCFRMVRNKFLTDPVEVRMDKYPDLFIKENPDIFLTEADIPEEVKERFFKRMLKIRDFLDYPDVFKDIPLDYFMECRTSIIDFRSYYGIGEFQKLVTKYPTVFEHLEEGNNFDLFSFYLKPGKDIDNCFRDALKDYFVSHGIGDDFRYLVNGEIKYNPPEWILPMNYHFVDKIKTIEELFQYNDSTFIMDETQRRAISILNIEYIKRFEKETGFFSHKIHEKSNNLEMFEAFCIFVNNCLKDYSNNKGVDFSNPIISYEDFLNIMARSLEAMRNNNYFSDYPDYDWIEGSFRDDHPEIFIERDAPEELRKAFYANRIKPSFLYSHKEFIPYLIASKANININAKISLVSSDYRTGFLETEYNFIEEYRKRYGDEKLFILLGKYGSILEYLEISGHYEDFDNIEVIEQVLKDNILFKIKHGAEYQYLSSNIEFVSEFPQLFVDFDSLESIEQDERNRLTRAFYKRMLTYDDIKKYPELISLLKDKDLDIAFRAMERNSRLTKRGNDLFLTEYIGKENFLILCSIFGRYMEGMADKLINTYFTDEAVLDNEWKFPDLRKTEDVSIDELSSALKEIIIEECRKGNIAYMPFDAPRFLRESCPELFLSDDAPEDLQRFFYNYGNNYPMTFRLLSKNREWIPFLEGKSIETSLLRNSQLKSELTRYFELFGTEKGIKLGIKRAETVEEMIMANHIELMKSWYDKTGGKFIPDFVVMENFSLEDADKFLISGSNWSRLMRIKSFASSPESRDAMLKLAYSFGAFDQDQRGFKKVIDLLTDIPKEIPFSKGYILSQLDQQIDIYSQRRVYYHDKPKTEEEKEEAYKQMLEYVKDNSFRDVIDTEILVDLLESIKEEKVDIDFSKPIFSQLYKERENGSFSLTIIQQNYPKTTQIIREILEIFRDSTVISPTRAHQMFGGFELKYDPDFREFLLANMDEVLENPANISFLASIQRQFSDIKAINSNRRLTWDLAVGYVQSNKYTSVNVGNEQVAVISAIAGYSQADFHVLQQIYNYGKQRVFSSIPRIEGSSLKESGNYTYEILRLDDPLAMAIGTLTDCCQELNNCAEVCMEHSMVDKNGRIFVIRDDKGNIVAQSWVWRNKDVLCFDNIEIPDKAFLRASKANFELERKAFTDDIFDIYKQAAHDLIEADEKAYKELLEAGKITKEEYDGLRLGKITAGLGYNDIAESLTNHSELDRGNISRPLPFEEPVRLSRGLYTSDSTTQYILEERDDRVDYDSDTLPIHSDTYLEYDDSNFTESSLKTLNRLENITKDNPMFLETAIEEYAEGGQYVSEIARVYGLNPTKTKIILHPNFAIIYDVDGDKIRIADLLFNTHIDNEAQQIDIEDKVLMQINLALNQISQGREIELGELSEKQKEMYEKAIKMSSELDIERGVHNAR